MAGIGFQLRKILDRDSYNSWLGGYCYAGVISCGPWIISFACIIILNLLLRHTIPEGDLYLFSSTITHVYAFSLILVGPLQMILIRYAADRFYSKQPEKVMASVVTALGIAAILAALLGGAFFFLLVPRSFAYQLTATGLMVFVTCIFVTANYLSSMKNFRCIVAAFASGYALSVGAGYLLSRTHGLDASLYGFLLGHVLLFLLLMRGLTRELGSALVFDTGVLRYFTRFPSLIFIGAFYNLGIWIDKFLFWWLSQQNIQIAGALYASVEYDLAIFISLLSIVPGMASFFLKLETGFAEAFERFTRLLETDGSLDDFTKAKKTIQIELRSGTLRLCRLQGIVTLTMLLCSDSIARFLGIGAVQLGIMRITLIGGFMLVLFLSMLTILFYFDDRRGALRCTAVFVISNAALSVLTLLANEAWYGTGFVLASTLGMISAVKHVNHRILNLEYYSFRTTAGRRRTRKQTPPAPLEPAPASG